MKALLMALLFMAPCVSAGVWDAATPAGTDPINQGDDRIREMKTAIAESLNRTSSGVFPGTNPATAPMFQWTLQSGLESARPTTNVQNNQLYFSTDTGKIDKYNTTSSTWTNVAISSNVTSNVKITGNLEVTGSITLGTQFNFTHIYATSTVSGLSGLAFASFGEVSDSLGEFNGSTWTVGTTGFYQLTFSAHAASAAGTNQLYDCAVQAKLNGPSTDALTTSEDMYVAGGTAWREKSMILTGMRSFTAGDTVQFLYGCAPNASTVDITASHLSIHRVP